ncbi:TIGR04438 family Trp-rich protein [Aquincola sp. MAHUQ-54]|uniref:TIGR04438 family Trp-rich protein n=1 Tax=Aquincola agrisoli TaxID=3119538 RepID=A0AAW9QHD3_9BURK
MWFVMLGVVLAVLKFAAFGPVGAWPWWWVLSPFALAVLWWGWADKYGYTKRRESEKMEAKKAERRRRHMEDLGLDTRHKPRK